ncbi:putative membrane protein [Collimonas pratensis]|uniref:Membrane protein n=1 Tax=Collimonas pratensis TaxID=279113 RepID=A0ABM5Z4R3_9BURK|nr:putative membrane protein [Collimonas pratensis]
MRCKDFCLPALTRGACAGAIDAAVAACAAVLLRIFLGAG